MFNPEIFQLNALLSLEALHERSENWVQQLMQQNV
uniref:SAM-dependent methyltransferase n=1 Tax=Ascaris lumbricoides TaxID=6252 RepID=A0A0M3IW43_ASCLU